jgi:hypothetical protein
MLPPLPAVAPVMLPLIVPIVHEKLEGALAASVMFGLVLLQIARVDGLVTTGVGFTVMVIVNGDPAQLPVVDVGVTMYSTLPAVALPGLVSTWFSVEPEPADAPVMPPVMFPIVQLKVEGALEVSVMFGLVALQIVAAGALVTAGVGFTVTVIVKGAPGHPPAMEVGVTIYSTVPAVALLGLVRVWLITFPALFTAPVIPPVMVPIVQMNVLGVVAVNAIFGPVPLHVLAVGAFVMDGVGNTVTVAVMVNGAPTQPALDVGVTMYSTLPEETALGLVSTWLMTDPVPGVAPPILPVIVPIVQEKVLGVDAVSEMFGLPPLQILVDGGVVMAGIGFTVTTMLNGAPPQLPVVDVGVTIYSTEPDVALPGLVNTWLMVFPDPADAPVMPPLMAPMVHEKLLAAVDDRLMFGDVPLQMVAAEGLVTPGVGFTVTVMV